MLLWNEQMGKQMTVYDFHIHKPLCEYIVDFVCRELMPAIEINGINHINTEEEDIKRQAELEKHGIRFLRFSDADVYYRMNRVVKRIGEWIDKNI